MQPYSADTERLMKRLFDSLSEKDRGRYAAVEAAKLVRAGSSTLPLCWGAMPRPFDKGGPTWAWPKDPAADRVRKRGVDENG